MNPIGQTFPVIHIHLVGNFEQYVCVYICIAITFGRPGINLVKQLWLPILLVVSRTGKTNGPLRIWSRETCSTVVSRVSPRILRTQPESGAYSRAPLLPPTFCDGDGVDPYRQPSFGKSRVYRVRQSRTDGVYRRESAGTRPVVLKVF